MGAHAGDAPPDLPGRGTVLDRRYELELERGQQRLPGGVRSVLWRAVDNSLDRHVAVRIVAGLDADARDLLTEAAASASRTSDARFVRVLDVGVVGRRRDVVWLATEWVEGPSLAAVLRGEPLRPSVATELVRQCAEALDAVERDGLTHGRLHADQVLLPPGGTPRITDLHTAATVHRAAGSATWDDVRGLGALLFASCAGQWPLPGWTGLAAADSRAAAQGRPRLVRAGIGRDVDEVTHRALTGTLPDPRSVVRALSSLPLAPLEGPPPTPLTARASPLRTWLWRIVPPVAVVAVGVTGWAIGSDLGRIPTSARQAEAGLPDTNASGPGHAKTHLVWHTPPEVRGFDPQGDGEENDDEAPLAVDHDDTTAWHTALYRDDSHLGGLKPGVGLLLDLGRPRRVRVAALAFVSAGATFQVRAGDRPPAQVDDLTLVGGRDDAGQRPRLAVDPAVKARYWLFWFTNLPPDDGGFRVGVAEVALLG